MIMAYKDIETLVNDYKDLMDTIAILINSFDASRSDIGDFTKMCVFQVRLLDFPNFLKMLIKFDDLVSSMESEKDRFEAQKTENDYYKLFHKTIDSILLDARTFKLYDYRFIDCHKRIIEFLLDVKDRFFN